MTLTTELRRLQADVGGLLERHKSARDISEFSRYANDPVGFIREVLGEDTIWTRQIEIAEAVRDEPMVVVRSANSIGKDWLASRLALWFVYCHQGFVLLTGPTERQVREVCMREVARAFSRAEDLPGELYRTSLRLDRADTAGILAFTSTEASRLTGFHAPKVMGVITEAQAVEDFAWEGILSCATGDSDRILAVGNPLAPSGRFYLNSRSANWRAIRISAYDHPNVIEGHSVIPGAVTKQFISRIASEYGPGSGIYKARVLGEFPDESLYGLVRRSWLEEAARKYDSGTLASQSGGARPEIGIDVARYGPDSTVLAIRRGPVLEEIVSWRGKDTAETVDLIKDEAARVGIRPNNGKVKRRGRLIVDEIGIGAGVCDQLKKSRYAVRGFNAGRRARDHANFFNARAESFWRIRKLLEEGRVAMPHDELLWDELVATEWEVTQDGRVRIEPKEQLAQRLGRSPDRADAVAYAFAFEGVPTARSFKFRV